MDMQLKAGASLSSPVGTRDVGPGDRAHRLPRKARPSRSITGMRPTKRPQSLPRFMRQSGKAKSYRADLSEYAFWWQAMIEANIVADFGGLNILVNTSAGLGDPQAVQGHHARGVGAVRSMSIFFGAIQAMPTPAGPHLEKRGRQRADPIAIVGVLLRVSAKLGLSIVGAARGRRHCLDEIAGARNGPRRGHRQYRLARSRRNWP